MTPPPSSSETAIVSFVPAITSDELARRNRAAIALLDEWAADVAGEEDQCEAMEVLRKHLGPDRIASNRAAFR